MNPPFTPISRNAYDAAGNGRRIRSWSPSSSGPRAAVEGTDRLRRRVRDSLRNDWAARSLVQKWVTQLIGVGVTPRWEAAKFTEAWNAHAKTCDAEGTCDAYALQALCTRAWIEGGEAFLRRRWRDPSLVEAGHLAAPVQYQLLESEFCPLFDADVWPDMPAGNKIRQGIELNKFGRKVAYWMYREHPNDRPAYSATPDQLIRIPAADVSHIFECERPGQLRGVSLLAPILVRLRNSADFEDAALERQKLANLFVAFLKRTIPAGAQIEYDALTGLPSFYNKKGDPLAGLEPGMFQELMPGEEMQFANPPEAGAGFSEYMRTTHAGTASGAGVPYEMLAGDIKDVSDRTLRVVINEFRRFAEQRQWHLVIPKICQPMVDWWAEAMALVDFNGAEAEAARRPEWQPHGWEYIHPVQDVEGKIKAIEAGLTTRSAEISRRGDDPRQVAGQMRRDAEMFPATVSAAAPAPARTAPPPQAEARAERDRFDALQAQQAAILNVLAAVVSGKADATVQAKLLETAQATAEAAKAAAEKPVEVHATLTMPDRESVTEIERDAAGDIARSKTIQRSVLQ